MSEEGCAVCPSLRYRLGLMGGSVRATARRIEAELEEPTTSRFKLLQAVQMQLESAAEIEWQG